MITLIEISLSNFQLSTLALDAIITISIIFLITKVVEKLKNAEKATHHRKNAEKKKTERDQQIKQFNIPDLHISTDLREKILNADASELLSLLNSGAVTSEEILLTYIERTRTIGLNNGLITEIAFKEALIQARECDRLRKENPSAYRGALFGLPISIKDMFILKNTDASCGLASRLFKPAKDDGYIVKVLKQEGAIPFVKSNVPQAILLPHTNNNVWGLARNPWDKERSAGGSSGGEAALIASRCSPLGLANDLGGSVRIPAFFCGVVGFKPTVGRVTGAGTAEVASTLDYLQGLKLVPGPITKSAKDVNLMMKALLSDQSHQKIPLSEQDPHYVRIPWDENKVNQKHKGLRIGYFTSMDYFPSSPANQRAVEEAAKALKSGGHEIVKVDFPNIENLVSISVQALMGDGEARFLLDTLEGEAPIDEHVGALKVTSMPQLFKKALRLLLDVLGEKRAVRMLDLTRKLSVYESTKLAEQQAKARKEFLKVWEDNKLDALLSPGLAIPAAKSSLIKDLGQAVCYATFFNVLDMPTGAVPVTVVKEGEDQYPKEATKYHDMMYRKTVESMQGTVGLPVGVQVTTLPWQEEKCVNVMIALEEELQFRKKYPFPI